MLKKILNRLGKGGIARDAVDSPERQALGEGEEFPQYPASHMGLPVTSAESVLKMRSTELRAIRQTLGLERAQFDSLILPVLERYVAFVHLLPATERDHHCEAGGLLRHALEVAYWAARESEGVVFVAEGTPLERKELEPRWHVAVCLAGLLRDIGRPICDLTVGDARGTLQWDPYSESLVQWTQRHRLERYFLSWRSPRPGLRECFAGLAAGCVLTPPLSRWLTEPEPAIMGALLQAIADPAASESGDTKHPVARLVTSAHDYSCTKDRIRRRPPHDDAQNVPPEQRLIEAMRALLANGTWTANLRGARVWVTSDGVFVVWKPAVEEILQWLKRERFPAPATDPRILAEWLITRGLAIPYRDSNGASHPYWPVAPEPLTTADGKSITLDMLRIARADMLFESAPPSVVVARVSDGASSSPVARGEPASTSDPPAIRTADTVPAVVAPPAVRAEASSSRPSEPPQPKVTTQRAQPAGHGMPTRSVSAEAAEDALAKHGEAGRLLLAMARDVAANPRRWGKTLVRIGERVIVRYPDGVSPYGEPTKLLGVLSDAGWLDLDPMAPFKKVRELNRIHGLVLTSGPAQWVLARATITPPAEPAAALVPGASRTTEAP